MTTDQAERIVFIAGGAMVVFTLAEHHFNPTTFDLYKQLWGVGALTLVLAITADLVPEVAGPLALLILTAAAVKKGKYLGLVTKGATN
jgi:hypothetical protein